MTALIPLALPVLITGGSLTSVRRLRRRGHRWPPARTACLLAGTLCVACALAPPVSTHDELFGVHVLQHLLLGMTGPALLALSAPITLALRTAPRRVRQVLPLSTSICSRPAACSAGRSSAPILSGRRPAVRGWLIAFVIAAAGHDTLSKLMYARDLPFGGGPVAARHFGAELMYYGGTVVDVALAAIIMTQWYPSTGRALLRERRRTAVLADQHRFPGGPA
jgi:putative membrane protein